MCAREHAGARTCLQTPEESMDVLQMELQAGGCELPDPGAGLGLLQKQEVL